jgi:glycosyltransferase involved in cell wall biosynthesis
MNRKKVLYIHHGKGLGGAPLSLLYLIEALDKQKYEPSVLFLYDSEIIALYRQKGITVHGPTHTNDFPHTKIWWHRWYHVHHFFVAVASFIKTVFFTAPAWYGRINPDIVHLNTSSLIAWGVVAYRLNIPVVWHIREPLADGYIGLRRLCIKKIIARCATTIVPISRHDAAPWKELAKTQVVYNAVKEDFFNPAQAVAHSSDHRPTILFLGGLNEEKGTLNILKAFVCMRSRVPHAQLWIAGYFDTTLHTPFSFSYYRPQERYKRAVLKMIEQCGDAVTLLGAIREVPTVMALSDVVVFPATVGHFARPVIEAGFMKKPVVASACAPLDELIVHEKTGFLIDAQDIQGWVDILERLCTDKSLNESMGAAAYHYCRDRFDLSQQVGEIEKLYEQATL